MYLNMNRFSFLIFFLVIVSSIMSQEVPQTVVFSAVVRNSDNEIIANSPIDVRLTFLEGGQYGTPVYCAVHRTATNSMGSMTVKLNRDVLSCGCNGASVLSFEDIPWENGDYWMQVEYRTNTIGDFLLLGRLELASAIYAFVADKTLELTDMSFYVEGVQDGDVLSYSEDTRSFEPFTLAHDPEVSGVAEVLEVGNSAEGRRITGLASPVETYDAVTKSYLDSIVNVYADMIDSLGGSLAVCSEGVNGVYRNHEYVDLGLPSGTMWATCNVGASSPEGCGNYYAWGETSPKDEYYLGTFIGPNPNEITEPLPPEMDAATVNWGEGWTMPTYAEIKELKRHCAWRWTEVNGVEGYMVRSLNGNSIFLPYYEHRYDGGPIFTKQSASNSYSEAYYMSKSFRPRPSASDVDNPYILTFDKLKISNHGYYYILQADGGLVRPVFHPEE